MYTIKSSSYWKYLKSKNPPSLSLCPYNSTLQKKYLSTFWCVAFRTLCFHKNIHTYNWFFIFLLDLNEPHIFPKCRTSKTNIQQLSSQYMYMYIYNSFIIAVFNSRIILSVTVFLGTVFLFLRITSVGVQNESP